MSTIEVEITRPRKERVRMCDRCGKFETPECNPFHYGDAYLKVSWGAMGVDGAMGGASCDYDLCNVCKDEFFGFMKERK
jgi:hypothetical protein